MTVYLIIFQGFSDGAVTDYAVFANKDSAREYALNIGQREVDAAYGPGKYLFNSYTEMMHWYNSPPPEITSIPGLFTIDEVQLQV